MGAFVEDDIGGGKMKLKKYDAIKGEVFLSLSLLLFLVGEGGCGGKKCYRRR